MRASHPSVRFAGTLGLLAAIGLGACSSEAPRVTTPGPTHSSAVSSEGPTTATSASARPGSPSPAPTASGKAGQMLDAMVVPPGSHRVGSLPGRAFAQPWEGPSCTAVVDESRFWDVAGDPSSVASYLQARPPQWIPYNTMGALSRQFTGSGLEGYPTGPGWSSPRSAYQLDVTVAADGSATGIRADAQVVPSNASCQTKDGPPAG